MVKKIYFSTLLSIIALNVVAMSGENTEQISHLQSQIKAVLRSWQRANATLEKIEKTAGSVYSQASTAANNLIAHEDVKAKMTAIADEQFDAIANQKASYTPINFLKDYFADKLAGKTAYLRIILEATANKAYRQLLWQKLINKEKELSAPTASPEA